MQQLYFQKQEIEYIKGNNKWIYCKCNKNENTQQGVFIMANDDLLDLYPNLIFQLMIKIRINKLEENNLFSMQFAPFVLYAIWNRLYSKGSGK